MWASKYIASCGVWLAPVMRRYYPCTRRSNITTKGSCIYTFYVDLFLTYVPNVHFF